LGLGVKNNKEVAADKKVYTKEEQQTAIDEWSIKTESKFYCENKHLLNLCSKLLKTDRGECIWFRYEVFIKVYNKHFTYIEKGLLENIEKLIKINNESKQILVKDIVEYIIENNCLSKSEKEEIEKIIIGWKQVLDRVLEKADKCNNYITYELLIQLYDDITNDQELLTEYLYNTHDPIYWYYYYTNIKKDSKIDDIRTKCCNCIRYLLWMKMLQDGTTTTDEYGSYSQMTLSVFINFIIDNVKAKNVEKGDNLTEDWKIKQDNIKQTIMEKHNLTTEPEFEKYIQQLAEEYNNKQRYFDPFQYKMM
jgi:hypothetical protein